LQIKKLSLIKFKKPNIRFKTLANLPKVFSKKEKIIFLFFVLVFLGSAVCMINSFWRANTSLVPAAGGIFREGIVGQPRFINPVLSALNDADRELTNLVYSGLFKYNNEGEIVPDLVKDYQISEDGKEYTLFLKENVYFHDKKKLDADDVVFTIKTIQNPSYKSPVQLKWLGVEIKKISDHQVTFNLQNAYPAFLETLTVKIMPAHIWQDVPSENFPWSPYNIFEPIGSGPYYLDNVSQAKSGYIDAITLTRFQEYHGSSPYINQIIFLFFEDQQELLAAANNNIIHGFPFSFFESAKDTDVIMHNFKEYSFVLPRYFALFLNSKENELLQDKDIRTALACATDKKQIINQALLGKGREIDSPFLPQLFGLDSPAETITFNIEQAKNLFEKKGFSIQEGQLVKIEQAQTMNFTQDLIVKSKGTQVTNLQQCLSGLEGIYPEKQVTGFFGEKTKEAVIKFQEMYADEILKPAGLTSGNGRVGPGTRKKLNEVCVTAPEKTEVVTITLTTSDDPVLQQAAKIIQEQWSILGIEIKIEIFSISELKEKIIKDRQYEILLFGQVLGTMPDPYPFWHSSQREYPGLNLSNYQDRTVDGILEKTRVEQDKTTWKENYQQAQELLLQDIPAIFLYNPYYTYFASREIKGINAFLIPDPSQRFAEIEQWYINTKRTLK
jgi:ABC-type transport system substrate-binding protein